METRASEPAPGSLPQADVRKLERLSEELRALADASHEFASLTPNLNELLRAVSRRLVGVVCDGCALLLVSADRVWLDVAAVDGTDPQLAADFTKIAGESRIRVGESMTGRVAESGEPVFLAIPSLEAMRPMFRPDIFEIVERSRLSALLALPLVARGTVLGVLNLARVGGETFDEDDRQLARDLADRAALAIDNARLRSELERRVLERTIELEAANQELEAFAYSVSHDLREPLRAIDGFSRALHTDFGHQLDPKGIHYVERVRAGARRMSALIDDLLQLSRVSRVPMKKDPVDLGALSALVCAELRKNAPDRVVETTIEPGLRARGDVRLLRIVLENLLGNAWKFTGNRADARIEVGVERRAEEDVFFVRDNGAGFDMAYRDKLFSPFQRLHRASEFEGTGVGLATVQRILRRHAGRIWGEGEVDRGATFFFTLGGREATGGDP